MSSPNTAIRWKSQILRLQIKFAQIQKKKRWNAESLSVNAWGWKTVLGLGRIDKQLSLNHWAHGNWSWLSRMRVTNTKAGNGHASYIHALAVLQELDYILIHL